MLAQEILYFMLRFFYFSVPQLCDISKFTAHLDLFRGNILLVSCSNVKEGYIIFEFSSYIDVLKSILSLPWTMIEIQKAKLINWSIYQEYIVWIQISVYNVLFMQYFH